MATTSAAATGKGGRAMRGFQRQMPFELSLPYSVGINPNTRLLRGEHIVRRLIEIL